ncbi:hypothetical protein L484_020086 [Morus notabilis]|uniref:Uncharacterized protein n=1 Tax=Morus notabilis TaxID=981085 RepID=W9RLP1_9ROSA|nr:hypothetical protein L484_020086 [Morus notabilis]
MVHRSSSQHRTSKFRPRKSSPLALTVQILCIFAFSVFLFLIYTRNSLEDEQMQPFLPRESQSQQVFQSF